MCDSAVSIFIGSLDISTDPPITKLVTKLFDDDLFVFCGGGGGKVEFISISLLAIACDIIESRFFIGSSNLSEKSISDGVSRFINVSNSLCLFLRLSENCSRLRPIISDDVIGSVFVIGDELYIVFVTSVIFNIRLLFLFTSVSLGSVELISLTILSKFSVICGFCSFVNLLNVPFSSNIFHIILLLEFSANPAIVLSLLYFYITMLIALHLYYLHVVIIAITVVFTIVVFTIVV